LQTRPSEPGEGASNLERRTKSREEKGKVKRGHCHWRPVIGGHEQIYPKDFFDPRDQKRGQEATPKRGRKKEEEGKG